MVKLFRGCWFEVVHSGEFELEFEAVQSGEFGGAVAHLLNRCRPEDFEVH